MRKKKVALIVKSFSIFFALGIALYNSKHDVPVLDLESTISLEQNNFSETQAGSQSDHFLIPQNHNATFIGGGNTGSLTQASSIITGGSSSSINLYTTKEEPQTSVEMLAYEPTQVSTSSSDGSIGGIYLPIPSIPNIPSKNKKENKNSFGTTIASAKTGFGTMGNNGGTDLPLAPPPPPVPLDGGTILVLLAGIMIAFYRFYIQPSIHAKTLRNSND